MGTTVSPASIIEQERGRVERAKATAATPAVLALTGDHGWRDVAARALPFVKRSV
jgi:hypothetical protein